ncbi:MAG: UbiD family decarboxylase domain-containing protein [Nitrospinota bacterium]
MAKSLREYIASMESQLSGALLRIERPVSPQHEVSALLEKARREKRGAAVYFSSIEGSDLPVVGNLITSRACSCLALGLEPGADRLEYMRALRKKLEANLPPVQVQTGPVQAVKKTGKEADLSVLPLLTHTDGDESPSLLMGAAVARNPRSGAVTVSLPQLRWLDKDALGIFADEDLPLANCISDTSDERQPIEVALVIGMHPAFYLAAAVGMDGAVSLGRIGSLLGEPLSVTRTLTGDLPVPAHAEIVIEGTVSRGDAKTLRAPASPIGYEGREREALVFQVKALTRRDNAIFQTAGLFGERLFLPTPIREAEALITLQRAVPAVLDVRIPVASNGYHAYVKVDQKRMGEAKKAIVAALGTIPGVKTVFAVDTDIDMDVDREVLWVLATRVVADRDLFMVAGVLGDSEDPSSYEITRRGRGRMVTRLGIDATTPIGLPYEIPRPTHVPGTEGVKLDEYLEDWTDGTA